MASFVHNNNGKMVIKLCRVAKNEGQRERTYDHNINILSDFLIWTSKVTVKRVKQYMITDLRFSLLLS